MGISLTNQLTQKQSTMKKWTIKLEIEVSDNWIQDGANPSEWGELIEYTMKENFLTCSYPDEFTVKATVMKEPTKEDINAILNA